jgi:hypothetical protein
MSWNIFQAKENLKIKSTYKFFLDAKKCTSKVFERVNTLRNTFGTVFKTPTKIIIGLQKYKSYSTWAISGSIL